MLNPDDLRLEALPELDAAWAVRGHGRRLRAVTGAAAPLRARLDASAPVVSARSLPITTLLYPSKFAFWSAALSPAPFVPLTHRALLVQFRAGGALKTLLFNPTDVEGARAAPYFARLIERFGETASRWVAKRYEPLEAQLAGLGLSADDVDYVAFDHFHTQDLRRLLGTADGRVSPRFKNATLLAPRVEWDEWDDLHPMQRAWYVADGKTGVRDDRVALTAGDLALGDGVMLLRTPGHTTGNQTLFFKTDRGVWGCSENGTCADNWSPRSSRVAGVAAAARQGDLDVLLNANTPEAAADQYIAMALEKLLVDRVQSAPDFVQMFPSSEVTPGVLAPGLSPTYVHNHLEHGAVAARR
jgi:hypothetical protein